jgi:stage II sporulation protein M
MLLLSATLNIINIPELGKVLSVIVDAIRKMTESYHNKALFYVVAKIFIHNAVALNIAIFSGALLSVIPVIIIVFNGCMLGFVAMSHPSSIGFLVPHGIFELPALVLACSYGIWLGLWPFNRGGIETLNIRTKQCMKIYFYIIIPLLIAAAIIEGSLIKCL